MNKYSKWQATIAGRVERSMAPARRPAPKAGEPCRSGGGPAKIPRFRLELDRYFNSVLAYARRSRDSFPRTCNLSRQRRHKFLLTQELC